MLKKLRRQKPIYYYYREGRKIYSAPLDIRGNLTGISGDLTDISGDINDCQITDEERKAGINIEDLMEKK